MMRVGIIVHSVTGNTLSVAEKLREQLIAAGHAVSLEKVVAANDLEPDIQKIQLNTLPDASNYDVMLFGAPVRGLSFSPVMQAYLATISSMQGKQVGCFVTQAFPFAWMGGNRAIGQAVEICKAKGAHVYGTGVINWLGATKREQLIARTVQQLSAVTRR